MQTCNMNKIITHVIQDIHQLWMEFIDRRTFNVEAYDIQPMIDILQNNLL